MRLRWRPATMSLATKCRVLFGVSAALIIGAALFVQWQRLEQLTKQLNLSAGRAVADTAIAGHVAQMREPLAGRPVTTQPASRVSALDFGSFQLDPPRLLAADSIAALPADSFERQSFDRFKRRDDRTESSKLVDTPAGQAFYFSKPLQLDQSCVQCHATPQNLQRGNASRAASASLTSVPSENIFGIAVVEFPNQIPLQQIVLNRFFLLGAGLLSGLLAIIVLSFVISRLILRPVRVLQETAEKVSEGDLNIRARISSGDEFQRLSETFNAMLINLKRSADDLTAANRTLDMKMVALAETNVGLNEANRLKTEFLANVSHELRTPLNSILGFAELLRAAPTPDMKVTRYIANITNSGSMLLELINDLLDIAKIEAGRMDVRPSDLSISDLLEGLVALLRPLAERKRLMIVAQAAPDVPIIHTDPARLQQVLYNLLSNAIKFSPEGERIDVNATRIGADGVKISVVDRGPGIDPTHHAVIFEKFRQVDSSATRQYGGTGLGLSISRELMRLLHGAIGVESEPGHGATFWCSLPVRFDESSTLDAY